MSIFTDAIDKLKADLVKWNKEVVVLQLEVNNGKEAEQNYNKCLDTSSRIYLQNNQSTPSNAVPSGFKSVMGVAVGCNHLPRGYNAPTGLLTGVQENIARANKILDSVNSVNNFPPEGYKIEDCASTATDVFFQHHPICEGYRANRKSEAIKAKTLADKAKYDANFPWMIGTANDPFKSSRVNPKTVKPTVKATNKKPLTPIKAGQTLAAQRRKLARLKAGR